MKVFDTGETHYVAKIQHEDGKHGYAVRHKDYPEVNEYETVALFDAIKGAKLYNQYLKDAMAFIAPTQWGVPKEQPNFDISQAH